MKPTTQKKSFGNLSLSYKPPTPSSNQIVSSKKGSFQVFSRNTEKKSTVRGSGIAPAPTPLNTRSLKSENSGKDVLVALVPASSSNPVWSQQSGGDAKGQDSVHNSAASEAARAAAPVSKPAPWSKPVAEAPTAVPVPVPSSTRPQMKSWADDDSDDDPEDLVRPPQRAPLPPTGTYSNDVRSAPPQENRPAVGHDEEDYRGSGGYGRQQYPREEQRFSQDSRGYQPHFGGGFQDARHSSGDRGGFSRYGSSGGHASGGFMNRGGNDMRPRGNSYDGGSGDGFQKRQYAGGFGNSQSSQARGSSGLPVAATLFGGGPATQSVEPEDDPNDGVHEEQRALELARMEREAILHKKRQLELQQQRLAEQERERELARERPETKPDPFGSRREHEEPSARGEHAGGFRDREFRTRQGSEGSAGDSADTWRRPPATAPVMQGGRYGEPMGRDDRRFGAGRAPERYTSGSGDGPSKIQQGTVHLMHRPVNTMATSDSAAGGHTSSGHPVNGHAAPQAQNTPHHAHDSAPRQLYDPKTGGYYTTDRGGKATTARQRSDSHGDGHAASGSKTAVKEAKQMKIKNREKSSTSEDNTQREPEESPAARRAREEMALKKEARDKEKASRPPHSKGLLFRYTDDAKTVELIEQVLTAEELAKKSSEVSMKSKRAEEKAESKRRKQKLQEEGKIRDLLKKSDEEKAQIANSEDSKPNNETIADADTKSYSGSDDSSHDEDDDSSSKAAHCAVEYLLASGATGTSMFGEPMGHAGTVVVGGTDAFLLSESEALLEFTEVTRKRSTKAAPGAASASSKKRPRSERKSSTSPVVNESSSKKEQTTSKERTAVAPALQPASAPQVSIELPAKPAWSAPKSTLKLVGGIADADDGDMQSPHADSKKQRREEKIATRKAKLDKKEELKKKKRELKAKMSNLDAGTSKAVSTAKTDHPADNSHPEVGKLAPALNTGPFTFVDRGNAPQERRQKDSAPDPRLEGHRRGDDSSSSAAESGTGPDSGSNVEDIHTVADTLPRRNLSSYQIFIPGQGLTNAPASPEASSCREVQWQQGQQQGQQIHFSTGSGGHASKHGDHAGRNQQYDSNRNGPFSSGGNQPPMGPPLASNHWGAELDQFSGFSGDGSQDWEQVPFIEGVSPDPLPARNGRNQPSSSRLQSWSANAAKPSPDGRAGERFFSQDQAQQLSGPQGGLFYKQNSNMQQSSAQGVPGNSSDNVIETYEYKFTEAANSQPAQHNNFQLTGEPAQNFSGMDNSARSRPQQATFAPSLQLNQGSSAGPKKIGSFEDLDDQVVIHADGVLEGGDGARPGSSGRRGRGSTRGRSSSRGRGRGAPPPAPAPGSRNGGFYQHPHAVGTPEASEPQHPTSEKAVDRKPAGGRGKGRGDKKPSGKPRPPSPPKHVEPPVKSDQSERPDSHRGGAGRGERGGRGRASLRGGKGRSVDSSNLGPHNSVAAAVERPIVAAGVPGGRGGRGRGRDGGRISRGGRRAEVRGPPAVPH